MYWRILKKDLKRRKTMNFILLLFVVVAAMFASGSLNNIFTVTNALDNFFEKAGMPDYCAATRDIGGKNSVKEVLDEIPAVKSYGIEPIVYISSGNVRYKGECVKSRNSSVMMSFDDAKLNYFDKNDRIINGVDEGCIWISVFCARESGIKAGDTIEISMDGYTQSFKVMGSFKDAALGSDMMGLTRYMLNKSDYERFAGLEGAQRGNIGSLVYIHTDDVAELEKALSENDDSIIFMGDKKMMQMTYVMNLVVAGVLLVVSVCLILIAFVVLRFTISFTLTQEYREIGVMKAIGISALKIRGLYMVKYLTIAVVGAMFGLALSIPFGNMMIKSVSENMVMGNSGGMGINIICAAVVVAVILLFCFGCTGKLKKFTPVDAIRNGETGERFRKKSFLRLGKSHVRPAVFMAANDILSSPRRFVSVILTFILCLSLMLILVNTVNTLRSGKLISAFGLTQSDAYLLDEASLMGCMVEGGRKILENELDRMEKILAENGMPAECANDVLMKLTISHGERQCKSQVQLGIGTNADDYVYFDGTPPASANEAAITKNTAQKLGVEIGDKITVRMNDGEREYLITAMYHSMNNMGEGVRLHETENVDFSQVSGGFAYQINFTGQPDGAEISDRIERIKELFDNEQVYTAGEYVENITGVADILNSVARLVSAVVITIIIFVTVLMEYSFMIRERGEIAIMKAIGFKNGSVMAVHILRFVLVAAVTTAVSLAAALPLTKLSIDPVFKMMGAVYGVKYEIAPMEIFVIYPLIFAAAVLAAAAFSSLGIRRIAASEASNIE